MAKNQEKKLTVSVVEKESKKLDTRIKKDVKGYKLEVDKVFKKTKIVQLVAELIKNYETSLSFKHSLANLLVPYIVLLITKHFTSLDIPDELEQQIKVLTHLVDAELLDPIIDVLPQEEIKKVFEYIRKSTEQIHLTIDEYEKLLDNVELENEEVNSIAKE